MSGESSRDRISLWQVFPVLLFLGCFFVYVNSNTRDYLIYDGEGNAYTALSIVRSGDLDLDEFEYLHDVEVREGHIGHYSVAISKRGHYVSAYPIGAAVLSAPLFAALRFAQVTNILELSKTTMSFWAALSVVFVYLSAAMLANRRWAVLVSFIYAFCTITWGLSSQAFWQHAPAQLCLSAAIYCLLLAEKKRWALFPAGLAAGFAVFVRPPMAVPAAILLAYSAWRFRAQTWKFIAGSLPPLIFSASFSWWNFGAPWRFGKVEYGLDWFRANWLGGIAGLIISPARGLIIYSPIFLLLPFGIGMGLRRPEQKHVYLMLAAMICAYILMMAKWITWWGGNCVGYRMIVDVTPAMVLGLAPALPALWNRPLGKAAIAFLLLVSFLVNFMVAEYYDYYWDAEKGKPDVQYRLWDWKDSPTTYLFSKMLAAEFGINIGNFSPDYALKHGVVPPESYFRQIGQRYFFFLMKNGHGRLAGAGED